MVWLSKAWTSHACCNIEAHLATLPARSLTVISPSHGSDCLLHYPAHDMSLCSILVMSLCKVLITTSLQPSSSFMLSTCCSLFYVNFLIFWCHCLIKIYKWVLSILVLNESTSKIAESMIGYKAKNCSSTSHTNWRDWSSPTAMSVKAIIWKALRRCQSIDCESK